MFCDQYKGLKIFFSALFPDIFSSFLCSLLKPAIKTIAKIITMNSIQNMADKYTIYDFETPFPDEIISNISVSEFISAFTFKSITF